MLEEIKWLTIHFEKTLADDELAKRAKYNVL